MNKVILMGRLTRDPEVRYSQGDNPIAVSRYSLAVNRRFKRDGDPDADFINCVAFGKQGEFAEKFLKKGLMICISGRIQVRSYDDQSGQKRWVTEVVVEEQDFAESKSSFESRMKTESDNPSDTSINNSNEDISALMDDIDDDDLPF
jgi:single-strand DNA-binding protein